MTSTTLNYLSAIGSILCFIVPAWELIRNKEKKGIRRITVLGWICIAIALYIGFVSFLSINAVNHEKVEADKISDSTRKDDIKEITTSFQKALKEYNLHYDSTKKEIVVIRKDSTNYFGVPNITLKDSSALAASYSAEKDTIKYTIKLFNYSFTDAYNFKFVLYMLGVSGNRYYLLDNPTLQDEGAIVGAYFGYDYHPTSILTNDKRYYDSIYFYIKSSYSNYYKTVNKKYEEWMVWDFSTNTWAFPSPEDKRRLARKLSMPPKKPD